MSFDEINKIKLVVKDEDRIYLNIVINKSNNLDYKYINFHEFLMEFHLDNEI